MTNGVGEVQREVMCGEVETVKGFCYLADWLNANGGCEAAVTARTRAGWKKFRECGEILFGKILFVDERKDILYMSYVRLAMLYGTETWCLRENKVAILRRVERFMVRAMCSVQLVDREYRGADGHVGIEGSSR